eukprot:12430918-Karenia_brevis.AAC.1
MHGGRVGGKAGSERLCYRCNRPGHLKAQCKAVTKADGTPLPRRLANLEEPDEEITLQTITLAVLESEPVELWNKYGALEREDDSDHVDECSCECCECGVSIWYDEELDAGVAQSVRAVYHPPEPAHFESAVE